MQTPFYFDWGFWAAIVAAIAVLLSQLPPIRHLVRRPKLRIELYSWISVLHKVGNPNAILHIILENTGGRDVRVKSIEAIFRRNGTPVFTLPAQNYSPRGDFKEQVLLTPFTLEPEKEWSHMAFFFKPFDRKEEKRYRELESRLKADIASKLPTGDQKLITLVVADEDNIKPIRTFFEERFAWLPGEYEMTVRVNTQPPNALNDKTYRFVLYESDSEDLKNNADGYKHGDGIYWESGNYPPLRIAITEVA
jgi:hypothetical protein